ncbi:Catechol 2,3-dioxygenase [Ferrimonas sediminum]|uniref:Catechol 2,3-dioxygenase n=1 Tax=Ferrimonas sediminum TaxID=718193 RepID=A0A1G8RK87_9GAMM|nr:VOC family protein [Ferrimonas sediminum]SDJ17361.1 Catechol 2,3-dioxygenase [Ferrimonas sediminum]
MKKLLTLLWFAVGSAQAAIPGMRGPDHIGVTVPNLTQATEFFTEVMGCQVFFEMGPFKDPEGNWMQENLNVDPRAEIDVLNMMRCGNGANLELFQYRAPEQNTTVPRNSDIGGHHLAFYVEDMAAAVTYLKEQQLEIMGQPKTMTEGPNAGVTWVYFLSPWGMQLELVSYPNGMAYEKETTDRLFKP